MLCKTFDINKANEVVGAWVKADQASWWDRVGDWWNEHWTEVVAGSLMLAGAAALILVTGGAATPFIVVGGTVITGSTIVEAGIAVGAATVVAAISVAAAAYDAYTRGNITSNEYDTLINCSITGGFMGVSAVIIGGIYYALNSSNNFKHQFASQDKFDEHYDKHVIDRQEFGSITKSEYLARANKLIDSSSSSVLSKVRLGGDTIYFNTITDEFAVVDPNGIIRSYFIVDVSNSSVFSTAYDYYVAQV